MKVPRRTALRRVASLVVVMVVATLAVMGVTSTVAMAASAMTSATSYEATTEDGVKVSVGAPQGALPDGATLHVDPVTSDEDVQAVTDELDEAEVSYDGFAAFDVYFTDADGNEIEPTEAVSVRFELPEGSVPEGAEDLAVHHLAEAEDGTVSDVEAVADDADATEGTVAVQDDATVDAEFTVESFSTFTIRWNYNSNRQVTVYYVDESGQEITGPQTNRVYADNRDWIDLDEYGKSIEGHTYLGAHLGSFTGTEVRWLTNRNGSWYYSNSNSQPNEYYGGDQWRNADRNVYLVYKADESEPEIPESNATVTTGKSAVKIADGSGNYELNLSVSGDRGQVDQKQKVDVLFILDLSNSMGESWGWNKRITEARNAISQITGRGNDVGLSDNESLDVRYALVGFAGGNSSRGNPYQDAAIRQNWTSSADDIYNEIPSDITYDPWGFNSSNIYGGGTNYEAGIRTGKDALSARDATRSDALVVTIFITDGDPTYYYNNNGATEGTGTQYDSNALRLGAEACEGLDTDYFYMVGVTNSVDTNVFNDMLDAVKVPESNKGKYVASDADQLLEAFADIQKQITFFDTQGVKMTDPLSDNADLVANDDGSYSFTLELERRENAQSGYESVASQKVDVTPGDSGTKVTLRGGDQNVEMTVFVDVDGSGKETIRVEFADDYRLAQNYRYTVSSTIAPSEAAISAFEANDTSAYDGTGEEHTGTHAGQSGFWSNDNANAKVDFTPIAVGDDDKVTELDPDEAPFPKPVIQVDESLVTPPEPVKPDLHKYVAKNDDGSYDLSLDVHGTVRSDQADPTKVDIVYVLDLSYSMMWDMDGTYPGGSGNTSGDDAGYNYSFGRYTAATDAINALNDKLGQTGIDARAALVTFARDTKDTKGFSSLDAFALPDAAWSSFETGTNYEAGLTDALTIFNNARSDAQKVVVFISDGEPNRCLDNQGNEQNQSAAEATRQAAEVAGRFDADKFYVVGVGDEQFESYLQQVTDGATSSDEREMFKSSNREELISRFEGIAAEITSVNCTGVTITDALSEYADLTDDAEFTVSITKGYHSGESVTVTAVNGPVRVDDNGNVENAKFTFTDGSGTQRELTLDYDGETKTFTLTFPEDYALEDGWTYTVTTQIEPSDTAVEYFNEHGTYPDTGEKITDVPGTAEENYISTDKEGFHTNTKATLTYESAGTQQTDEYPNPVITFDSMEIGYAVGVEKVLEGADLEENMFEFSIEARQTGNEADGTFVSADEAAKMAGLSSNPYKFSNGTTTSGAINGLRGMSFTSADARAGLVFEYLITEIGMSDSYQGDYSEDDFVFDETQYLLQFKPVIVSGRLEVQLYQATIEDGDVDSASPVLVGTYPSNGPFEPVDASLTQSEGGAQSRAITPEYTLTFTNELRPLGLQIVKIEKGTATRLPNAYFSLVDEDGNEVPAYRAPEATEDNRLGADEQATNADGILYFYGLKDGKYTLTETRFPSGYQAESEEGVSFQLKVEKGAVYVKNGDGEWAPLDPARVSGDPADQNSEFVDHCFYMQVSNVKLPDIPASGSSGTLFMMSAGFAAIVLAGVYLSKKFGNLRN